jgi:xanthine dehydrogenase YagR molybdenum-binding subunit
VTSACGVVVQDGSDQVRRQAITMAVNDSRSPLHRANPEDVIVHNGRMQVKALLAS